MRESRFREADTDVRGVLDDSAFRCGKGDRNGDSVSPRDMISGVFPSSKSFSSVDETLLILSKGSGAAGH